MATPGRRAVHVLIQRDRFVITGHDWQQPLACRAQTYRYSEYTGATRGCTCHDTSFADDEEPQSVCQGLYDALFDASYSAGGSNREYNSVTSAPGLSCEEIVTDPCDNTDY